MFLRSTLLAGLALAVLTVGTGCSNKTQAERDSLLNQNKSLQDQLAAEKAARADAEARAAAGQQASTVTPPVAPPAPPADNTDVGPASTGDIGGGITRGTNKLGEATIQIASDVLFDSGKATLKPAAKKTLDKVAGILKKEYAGQTLRVEGHTDPNPVKKSGWDDNWDLGAGRARAVLLYLETKGIAKKNMYIASFADTDLKSTKNYALDRRVEIVVVKAAK